MEPTGSPSTLFAAPTAGTFGTALAASAVSCASCRIRAASRTLNYRRTARPRPATTDAPATVIARSAAPADTQHPQQSASRTASATGHPRGGGSAGDFAGPASAVTLARRAPTAALPASLTAHTPPQLTLTGLRHCRPTEPSPSRIWSVARTPTHCRNSMSSTPHAPPEESSGRPDRPGGMYPFGWV